MDLAVKPRCVTMTAVGMVRAILPLAIATVKRALRVRTATRCHAPTIATHVAHASMAAATARRDGGARTAVSELVRKTAA